jgi:hypothetical protein
VSSAPSVFRVYGPGECGEDGYPFAWHKPTPLGLPHDPAPAIKDFVRLLAGNRCERCLHPYAKGEGQWSSCDRECRHLGPVRMQEIHRPIGEHPEDWIEHNLTMIGIPAGESIQDEGPNGPEDRYMIAARWRILTVHHLDGVKANCLWWNLAALCQRCHLTIQGKVYLDRPYHGEHSDWFKIHAAGWYAFRYLEEDVSREEAQERMDELLALEGGQSLAVYSRRVYP